MDETLKPIRIPRRITSQFIRTYPWMTFLYGRCLYARIYMGQEAAVGELPNAVGIPTKIRNCKTDASAFFSDDLFERACEEIDTALAKIPQGAVVIPFPKIGCGCAQLPTRAPRIYSYLQRRISEVQYGNIIVDPNYVNIGY